MGLLETPWGASDCIWGQLLYILESFPSHRIGGNASSASWHHGKRLAGSYSATFGMYANGYKIALEHTGYDQGLLAYEVNFRPCCMPQLASVWLSTYLITMAALNWEWTGTFDVML